MIENQNINQSFSIVKNLLGYCPQQNMLFNHLTVEEHILYYMSLKGITVDYQLQILEESITNLDLQDVRKKKAGILSGGNKRKLQVALSLIGNPPIVLLDEPSAGMDPGARNQMWKVIEALIAQKTSSVILTTHSMQEAESVSQRIGIMTKGGILRCLGTQQHLRDKFGTGFAIEIKARVPNQSEIEQVVLSMLDMSESPSEELRAISQQKELTKAETGQILTEAGVPFLVIDSIINLQDSQKLRQGSDMVERVSKEENQRYTKTQIANEIFVKGSLFGVIEALCQNFTNVQVVETYGNYMKLSVEKKDKTIGFLFQLLEELRDEHQLEDYSISQTTLEQIFQRFADLTYNEKLLTYYINQENGEMEKMHNSTPQDK